MTSAEIGVFGGSGFYSFLEGTETVDVDTPYGKPSAPPVVVLVRAYEQGRFFIVIIPPAVKLHYAR